MSYRLKPLSEQVIVITGATSGIGLVTARKAADRGARLVLAGRNEPVLRQLADEIREKAGEAVPVVADVGEEADVRRIAQAAVERFGGFDTWVNNAGVSIYGKLDEVSVKDERALFETNYWGVVHGSREAVRHLRERGGALINLGSMVSDRAVPLQGAYSASKAAVKNFTDALRMELEADGLPVSVTLIKPSAIDTPFEDHAKNYMEKHPQVPQPVYHPELAAKAILHAAEHPVRDLYVGGGGRLIAAMGMMAPSFTDFVMRNTMIEGQKRSDRSRGKSRNALRHPRGDGRERSRGGHWARRTSLYTTASMHPFAAAMVALGLGAAAAAAARYARGGRA